MLRRLRRLLTAIVEGARWRLRALRAAIGVREVAALVLALVLIGGVAGYALTEERADRLADARTAFENCGQIELVKDEIRGTVQRSRDRLPKVGYYRTHPDELAIALEDADKSVERFKERDCLKLPAVIGYTPDELRR